MKISEILIEAKKKIDTPEKWTKGTLARDSKNQEVDFDSKNAVCFCSIGALEATVQAAGSRSKGLQIYICGQALGATMGESISGYNDAHTHEEVMAAWDRAIELQKLKEDLHG